MIHRILMLLLASGVLFAVCFEAAFWAFYCGPSEWYRWAWLHGHGFKAAAARERARIYRAKGLPPPTDGEEA